MKRQQRQFIAVIMFALFFNSCSKKEFVVHQQPLSRSEAFFKIAQPLSADVNTVYMALKSHDEKKHFVIKLPDKYGVPLWSKMMIRESKGSTISVGVNTNSLHSTGKKSLNSSSQNTTDVFIPLSMNNKCLTSVLTGKLSADSIIGLKCITTDALLAKCTDPLVSKNDAERLLSLFMVLEGVSFHKTQFKNVPTRLFPFSRTDVSEGKKTVQFRVKTESQSGVSANFYNSHDLVCVLFQNIDGCTCYQYPDGEAPGGGCDWQWCPTGACTDRICWDYYYDDVEDDGGGSGGGGYGSPDPGGLGGGGVGGSGGGDVPMCTGSWYDPDPCLNATNGDTDENGYYYDRMDEIIDILNTNPEALLPCDQLPLFKTLSEQFFQKLTTFNAPQSVKDRIQNIINTNSNFSAHNLYIQTLDDAKGPIVNCDYFPINITSLPSINGQTQASAAEFLEYFRLHMSSFAVATVLAPVAFNPYNANGLNETMRWSQGYDATIGTLIHIPLVAVNDGSVIETAYDINSSFPDVSYTFSTIHTPTDAYHPVSGNRRFGIVKNNAGSLTFYISGVDRISTKGINFLDAIGHLFTQQNGFDAADVVWWDIQTNIINYINTHGGSANYFTNLPDYRVRPKWSDVELYLKKQIDYTELKRRLGC